MRKNKIGAVFLVATLALAGLGISYAGFFDDITVHGSVDTATVELTVEDYSGTWVCKVWGWTGDPPAAPVWPDLTVTWIPTQEVLIIRGYGQPTTGMMNTWLAGTGASWSYEAGAMSYIGTGTDYDVVMVWDHIFPCIDFSADILVHYTGSIPAHVDISDLTWTTGEGYYDFSDYTTFTAYRLINGGSATVVEEFPIQMHFCDYVNIVVTIHLPQLADDTLQGLHGEFGFNIHALQWNDLCEPPSGDKVIELPDGIYPVWFEYPVANYYFHAHLSGIPAGYNVWDGSWGCWCVDQTNLIYPGQGNVYHVKLYSTYDPAIPVPDPQWPQVNWIINNKADYPTATKDDFQAAIWYFVDGGTMPGGIGATIVADANTYGSTFVPQTGQLIAVLLYPVDVNGNPVAVQRTIIEVDP